MNNNKQNNKLNKIMNKINNRIKNQQNLKKTQNYRLKTIFKFQKIHNRKKLIHNWMNKNKIMKLILKNKILRKKNIYKNQNKQKQKYYQKNKRLEEY